MNLRSKVQGPRSKVPALPLLSGGQAAGRQSRKFWRLITHHSSLITAVRGYTLAEMMIVVAIIGVIFTLGPNLMVQTIRFFQLSRARIEIQRDGRESLDIINRNLRQARSSTVTVDQVTGQPPFSRIRFTTIDGRTMIFYQQNKNLYQIEGGTKTLSGNLRYIGFTYPRSDDATILSVAITMEKETYQGGAKALQLSVQKVRVMNN
ncbi:MAG: prepilin-type N-terminal cleavage/methylation domain-containing protein [Elusimicrobia bacterium]|nr:prepilin-type N-terminal cleavage/methylation domain-containing protein [Elusimicrobiota bacterium]